MSGGLFKFPPRFLRLHPDCDCAVLGGGEIARFDFDNLDRPGVEFQSTDHQSAEHDPPVPNAEIVESGGSVTFTILRLGSLADSLTVRVATRDGAAQAGKEYIPFDTEVTFAPGRATAPIAVRILDDSIPESDKEFSLVLADATGRATVGPPVKVLIRDDEPRFTEISHYPGSAYSGLTFRQRTNEVWHVEASSDLKTWTREGISYLGPGFYPDRWWSDRQTVDRPWRFYRAIRE
jgi:hypothetical protein